MTTLEDLKLKRIAVPVLSSMLYTQDRHSLEERKNNPIITELVGGRDYFVRAVVLPRHIAGVSSALADGTYNIYVNSSLAIEIQWEAFLHELIHCEAGHFDEWKDLPNEVKEWEATHLRPSLINPEAG